MKNVTQSPLCLWKCFLSEEGGGAPAMEHLLLVSFVILPCMQAVLLLEDVLREYLGLEILVITSPFF